MKKQYENVVVNPIERSVTVYSNRSEIKRGEPDNVVFNTAKIKRKKNSIVISGEANRYSFYTGQFVTKEFADTVASEIDWLYETFMDRVNRNKKPYLYGWVRFKDTEPKKIRLSDYVLIES